MTEQPFRSAPHNLEAEQALLGAILINNDAHNRVSDFLSPSHFYDPLHGQIYETAAKLIASGKQATPITLQTFFETAERIDATLTVPQYLGRLAANAATIINARDYEQTIYDLATRRQLIVIGEDMAKAAYDSPVDFPPKEQIEEVETRLFSLAETGKYGQGFQAFRDASNAAVAMALSARKRGGGISGLATGLCTLDAKTGGLQPSDLIILAGRPSMGKTALATNIAFNVARAGTAVGFFRWKCRRISSPRACCPSGSACRPSAFAAATLRMRRPGASSRRTGSYQAFPFLSTRRAASRSPSWLPGRAG